MKSVALLSEIWKAYTVSAFCRKWMHHQFPYTNYFCGWKPLDDNAPSNLSYGKGDINILSGGCSVTNLIPSAMKLRKWFRS